MKGLGLRKAVFVDHRQAVPLNYRIDARSCIQLGGGSCGRCVEVCPAGAVDFLDPGRTFSLQIGSLILAPGLSAFNPSGLTGLGYGRLANVVTSVELESFLSAAGPTAGRLIRPSDGEPARRIAWIQCVGSRDVNHAGHGYCSAVCCMSALKQASLALRRDSQTLAAIHFVDIRSHGKNFERYYRSCRELGVRFHRCLVQSLEPGDGPGEVTVTRITNQGRQAGENYDLVVLSVGLHIPDETRELARRCGVELGPDGFTATTSRRPTASSREGVFVCGAFTGPKDMAQSMVEASSAAGAAVRLLPGATAGTEPVADRSDPGSDDPPRTGVFVCHCGSNIADAVDVEALSDYAAGLPGVVSVDHHQFACSQEAQNMLRQRIAESGLNRVVAAACTPRSHEAVFRESMRAAGLNPNLLEMANIRNQVAWVHGSDHQTATAKARDLVRMAVAKASLLTARQPRTIGVEPRALVVGGGVAGMEAALRLAGNGFPVHLVEKTNQLGGAARHLHRTWRNESIQDLVNDMIQRVTDDNRIAVHLFSEVSSTTGLVGSFRSIIHRPDQVVALEHGVTIVTTGGRPLKPDEYEYGRSRRVFNALEFDKLHLVGDRRIVHGRSFVFIQCVGSREEPRMYCSRVCCTHSILAAIALKEENPDRRVYILYRDIRSYGERENLYTRARQLGVVFIKYHLEDKPRVETIDKSVRVEVTDHVLAEPMTIEADVVVLAAAIEPHPEVHNLAQILKLPVGPDGFLQEAHPKLRPVEFAAEGVFLAGLAHCPKPIEESIAQSQAAAARALTILSREWIELDTTKAEVIADRCDGCAVCVDACPFEAITVIDLPPGGQTGAEEERAGPEGRKSIEIDPTRCKGCGCCMASCPKDGVDVVGFTMGQLRAQIRACLPGPEEGGW